MDSVAYVGYHQYRWWVSTSLYIQYLQTLQKMLADTLSIFLLHNFSDHGTDSLYISLRHWLLVHQ